MSSLTLYYLYSKLHWHFIAYTTRSIDNERVGSTTTPVPDTGPLGKYYLYNPQDDTWTFDLKLYKEHKKGYVTRLCQNYLDKRLLPSEKVVLSGLLSLSKITLDVMGNKLTEEQRDQIVTLIRNIVKELLWLQDVTDYYKSVIEAIDLAPDKDSVDQVLNEVDFTQFDDTFIEININEHLRTLESLLGVD